MAATQKTLTPTNEVISIPAFADKPDYRLPIDSTGKLADAINELDSKIGNHATTINSGKIALNRSANIVTMDIEDGTYTTNNNGVLIAGTSGDEILIPSGYRPQNTVYLYDGTTNKPIQVRSTGKLVATCNNTPVRVSGSWITNNGMPT